jgi:hypothetical protein
MQNRIVPLHGEARRGGLASTDVASKKKKAPTALMVEAEFSTNWPFGGRATTTPPNAGGSEAAVRRCRD